MLTAMLDRIAAAITARQPGPSGRHLVRSDVLDQQAGEPEAHLPVRGPAHLVRALAAWREGILEPGQPPIGDATGQPERIDDMMRGPLGSGWTWRPAYTKNGQAAWCGFFAAWCLGDAIPSDDRARIMPSTYRLQQAAAARHPGLARLSPTEAQPGDVLVVRNARDGKAWGDHITIVERVDPAAGLIHTVEGNARGWVPGARMGVAEDCREGVIRRTRPMRPGLMPPCPVSGLRQSAYAHAVYRWTLRESA
jgi:hypothetical protein